MSEVKPAIKVRDLVVGFGDQTVLNHLDLNVRAAEILGVVGASGAGKSVLLRTIIGLLPRRHGSIEVLGTDLAHADEEARRALERRDAVGIVRMDSPALDHGGQQPVEKGGYFFFSACQVCLRSRGQYLFNFNFSPPGFRRSV